MVASVHGIFNFFGDRAHRHAPPGPVLHTALNTKFCSARRGEARLLDQSPVAIRLTNCLTVGMKPFR
jgi:hypothetical protein